MTRWLVRNHSAFASHAHLAKAEARFRPSLRTSKAEVKAFLILEGYCFVVVGNLGIAVEVNILRV